MRAGADGAQNGAQGGGGRAQSWVDDVRAMLFSRSLAGATTSISRPPTPNRIRTPAPVSEFIHSPGPWGVYRFSRQLCGPAVLTRDVVFCFVFLKKKRKEKENHILHLTPPSPNPSNMYTRARLCVIGWPSQWYARAHLCKPACLYCGWALGVWGRQAREGRCHV